MSKSPFMSPFMSTFMSTSESPSESPSLSAPTAAAAAAAARRGLSSACMARSGSSGRPASVPRHAGARSSAAAGRPTPARTAAALGLTALLLTSCGPARHGSPGNGGGSPGPPGSGSSPSRTAPADGALPVGPGPQPAYRVQTQPVPGSCHYRHTADNQPLPDASCTPGATNPRVTQTDLMSTICRSGYTSGIRPPLDVTAREKPANAKSYSYTGPLHDAEYDHLVSLELGGDPNDPRNLWVEPPSPGHKPGSGPANDKDTVENTLHSAVCNHKATLADAQRAIADDWTTAEATLGLKVSK